MPKWKLRETMDQDLRLKWDTEQKYIKKMLKMTNELDLKDLEDFSDLEFVGGDRKTRVVGLGGEGRHPGQKQAGDESTGGAHRREAPGGLNGREPALAAQDYM